MDASFFILVSTVNNNDICVFGLDNFLSDFNQGTLPNKVEPFLVTEQKGNAFCKEGFSKDKNIVLGRIIAKAHIFHCCTTVCTKTK